ncbi:MAG: hypothetical protein GX364_05775 [Firmicutes bacterium]|jgi:spore germination protein YaaH|nr:hypothetical protein [Bacillota bacterium]
MKRIIYIFSLLLAMAALLLASGCAEHPGAPASVAEEQQVLAISWAVDGREVSSPAINNADQPVTIVASFDRLISLNTAIIEVAGSGIEGLEIYAPSGNSKKLVYKQDYVEKTAFCTFPALFTNKIVIEIATVSGRYSVKDITFRNQRVQDAGSFRTTAYIVADTLQKIDDMDEGHLANITDIILFGMATFNKNGDIKIDPRLDNSLDLIKQAQARLNRNYTVYVNFLFEADRPYDSDWNRMVRELAVDVAMAKKGNRVKLADNMIGYVKDKGFDGLAFDWEYPVSYRDFNVYGNFILCLKEKKPDLKVAVALAPWGIKFNKKHIDAIDVIELMCYDLPDSRGHHSSFYTQCIGAIEYMKKKNIPLSKVDLGIPFYARPDDMAELWTLYKDESEKLGRYSDRAVGSFGGTEKDRFYNCYQTAYNKTSYSLDQGLGGVMVWHYACDNASDTDLSLFKAISSAIRDRYPHR